MSRRFTIAVSLGTLALLGGCEKSADERTQEVAEAQDKADQNTREAVDEAQRKSAEARQEATEKIAKEQLKLEKTLAENRKDLDVGRANLRKDVEDKLIELDKRLLDLRAKLTAASDTKLPKAELTHSLDKLQAQADSLRRTTTDLNAPNDNVLDATKQELEARTEQLSKSIDDLERKID